MRKQSQHFWHLTKPALLAAFAFAGGVPSSGHAQDTPPAFIVLAASTSLTALPDQTIAVVKGTGLRPPSLTSHPDQPTSVILWDELRPAFQQPLANSGTSTITVNGALQ